MKSQNVSLILVGIGSGLAALAYLHRADTASVGQMFTFAGGIITGAFALLRSDKEDKPKSDDPTQPPAK